MIRRGWEIWWLILYFVNWHKLPHRYLAEETDDTKLSTIHWKDCINAKTFHDSWHVNYLVTQIFTNKNLPSTLWYRLYDRFLAENNCFFFFLMMKILWMEKNVLVFCMFFHTLSLAYGETNHWEAESQLAVFSLNSCEDCGGQAFVKCILVKEWAIMREPEQPKSSTRWLITLKVHFLSTMWYL